MALRDEIEAHKAAIDTARDEARAKVRLARQEGRELTAAEQTYIQQRRNTIQTNRQQMFPKARQALKAFLDIAVERNFSAGAWAVDITEAAIITNGWQGPDDNGSGSPTIYTHSGGPMLMLRAEIKENGVIVRTPLKIHLVPEPRMFVDTGATEPNPDAGEQGEAATRPVFGFNLRRALRLMVGTFPEIGGRLNA